MSDLQELIHKTSMDCIDRGRIQERKELTHELQILMETCRLKLKNTTGETTAIRLMGTIIGLEHAIKTIESRTQ